MYADKDFYINEYGGTQILDEKDLQKASEDVDSLTFNRARDFERLTPFQQEIIKRTTCKLAEFEVENADLLEGIVSSYSLNGASVSFGTGQTSKVVNGTCVRNDIYSYLEQSGLCTRRL